MKGAVLADWADCLEDWTVEQVHWALRKWRDDFPSKRPNPSHISKILKDERGRKLAPIPRPEPEEVTLEVTLSEDQRLARKAELDEVIADLTAKKVLNK